MRGKSWTIEKVFFAQFDVRGRFSQAELKRWVNLRCPQFVFLRWSHFQERTPYIILNQQIEGTENECPQFLGGRFCQVVARTGSTVDGENRGLKI